MKLFRSSTLVVLTLASAISMRAQTSQGRVLGTVTDPSGAAVVNARVTIINTATNVGRNVVTNNEGDFIAPALDPGLYKVSAEAPGFKKAENSSVLLEVSRDARVDLHLQAGAVTETVNVTEEETLVDTADSSLNGVISNKAINELPLQGRDFQNLLPLHPGVQRTPGGGFHSVTSNGNRPDDNNFFIDGADDNDVYYGETVVNDAGIAGTPASMLPLDSIEEFNTQESPSADYGVKPGVVMNLGLKSGTNAVHGTAYYFHRNSAFDARNYFDPAPSPVSALILHEFGASVGGPIKKDKWFYFVNYEGIRDKVGNPGTYYSPVTTSLVPQTARLADLGYLPTDFSIVDAEAAAGCPSAPTCNPLSYKISKLFLPNPGFTLNQNDPSTINFDFNNTNKGDNLVAKTDYKLTARDTLSARLIYSNTNLVEDDTTILRPEWLSAARPRTQVFGFSWTSTLTQRWLNQARFSYNRFYETIAPADSNLDPNSVYGINTGVTDPRLFGFPRINVADTFFDSMGGNQSWPLGTTPTQTENYSDTVSYSAGRHNLRFGGEYRDGKTNYFRAGEGRGRVIFDTLENFYAGNPYRWELLYGDPARNISMKSFGFFAQDDFRATSRLTLNIGLRYDVTDPIKDSRNLLANYIPDSTTGLVQVGKGISSPYPTNYNNISPRLGFAWDIFGTGKTVLRAGGGIIFEQPSIRTFMFNGGGLNLNPSGLIGSGPGTITSFLRDSEDTSVLNWNTTGPAIFPAAADATCNFASQCDVFGVDQHLKTPYVANWNLNVQHQLAPDTVLQVAYVANRGIKLYSVQDLNQINPAVAADDPSGRPLVSNCPAPVGLGTGGPCFPYIGYLDYLSNKSNSIYHSLQVTLTKRFSHGLYLLAGYTWAHAIDTATSNLAGVPQNSLDYSGDRGNGDYDIRNRFTLSATYELPSFKTKGQILEGWQVTTIATIEGALPYTLYDGGDDISETEEFNDRWNIVGDPGNIHWSAKSAIPYFYPGDDNAACAATATTPALLASLQYNGCYAENGTLIVPPAFGTFGNMGRNIFRGPNFRNWDFSVSKIWKFNERLRFQFRAEFFNLLNHTNFDSQSMSTDLYHPSSVGTVTYTPDLGSASNPVLGSGGSRHIQLGAKFIF
jgi:Carboxypeptidase regulatory-like domain/TonB dependent receptor